jgi:hypothetical protein
MKSWLAVMWGWGLQVCQALAGKSMLPVSSALQQRVWVVAGRAGHMAAGFDSYHTVLRCAASVCIRRSACCYAAAAAVSQQIAGGQRYRPPAVDVNAPDLFIPLMGLWSYALISCVVLAFKQAFKPEMMSSTVRQQQAPRR